MNETKEHDFFETARKHEKFVGFICFLTAGLMGYFLTHYMFLLGA